MLIINEYLDWFEPYNNLKPEDIVNNIKFSQAVERQLGQSIPERSTRKIMARYDREELIIDFDWPEIDDSDYLRSQGTRIYYPIREPKQKEYTRNTSFGKRKFADGFGSLYVSIDDIEENELAILAEEKIYPYSVLVDTPSGIFYSLAKPVGPEDHPLISSSGISFAMWKPGEPYKDNGETGFVYLPLDLPSLRPLKFKFMEVEPSYIHEQMPSFEE